jgi:hypothetical protein
MTPPRPVVSPALLEPCPSLEPASDGALATILENHVKVAEKYSLCRQSKQDLIEAIHKQPGIDSGQTSTQ